MGRSAADQISANSQTLPTTSIARGEFSHRHIMEQLQQPRNDYGVEDSGISFQRPDVTGTDGADGDVEVDDNEKLKMSEGPLESGTVKAPSIDLHVQTVASSAATEVNSRQEIQTLNPAK